MKLRQINEEEAGMLEGETPITQIPVVQQSETEKFVADFSRQKAKEDNTIIFKPTVATEAPKGIEQAMDIANKVTGEAFGQAMIFTVKTDDDMQDQLLTTAKQVIKDKTDSIADMAQTERKAKFFDKNADACQYFGYEEKTTSPFHVKAMAFWAFVLNSIYIFTIGYLIVSPITFILSKIKVVVKKTWVAFIFALLVYLLAVGLPVLVAWLTGMGNKFGMK